MRRLSGDIRFPARSTIHAVFDRHSLVSRIFLYSQPRARSRRFQQGPTPMTCGAPTSRASSLSATSAIAILSPSPIMLHAILLMCEALVSLREETAFTAFEQLFRRRGLPLAIRSDNGVPFASPMPCSISPSSPSGGCRLGISHRTHQARSSLNRTAAMNACTAPSKKRHPPRWHVTACSNRPSSTPSSTNSTPNDPTRRSP